MSEALVNILAEMRDTCGDIADHEVVDYADRIEAAAEREKVEAVTLAAGQAVNLTNEKWRRDMGNTAAMRAALERILDIEGYGAPMIEAKVIAQKALEGQQCTPPPAQERPQIEQPANAAALRAALLKCYQLAYEWEGNEREGIAGVEAPDSAETLFEIQSITTKALSAAEGDGR